MSARRLRAGEWLTALGAAALLVALFVLKWFTARSLRLVLVARFPTVLRIPGVTGWEGMPTLRWFALVTVALALLAVVTQAMNRGPALPVTLDLLAMLVAGVTSILLVIRLATAGDLRFGAVLGLAGSVATTLGAFHALRAEQGWAPGPARPIEVVAVDVPDGPRA